ncbi:MAG: thioredoxin protein [Chthoniobacteraceae bacterium]|nr:thioredoxin protein [Chthoniobacteraceae bacterium]
MSLRIFFLLSCFVSALHAAEQPAAIDWQPWSDSIFEKAKREHRFVMLDLGAVWCHWCHVMDELTYQDPKVIALLKSRYIAVRVDQDSRPDLANRYEDYGWPATIFFNEDGGEIVKRRGYIPPEPMASLLQAIIDDPTPGPSVEPEAVVVPAKEGALTAEQRSGMRDLFLKAYDDVNGGWGDVHKYLNWDALEYCLTEGINGDAAMEKRARQTLTAGLKLIDPVWGGVYQYSTDGDWDHPHFEKIMPFQTENMRVFALAASLWNEPRWSDSAQKIRGYLKTFLTSKEGAFYTSQDADVIQGEHSAEYFALNDAARRARGIPRIDTHIYSRENGLAITGLAALYATTGDESCLAEAKRAAQWIRANRKLEGGGYRHGETDGLFMADTLAMGRACLALYTVTAERAWLANAIAAAAFIDVKFKSPAGFASALSTSFITPAKPQVDENIALVRFSNMLANHTGDKRWRSMAEHAMRYLASPVVVDAQGYGVSGILLADRELRIEPAHITIVGAKDDPAARALFEAALKMPGNYKRLEWWDSKEGPMPNPDVQYPELARAAAFVCKDGACSAPIFLPGKLLKE